MMRERDVAAYSRNILESVWSVTPDAAIEAGRLPPVLWEDPTQGGREAVRDRIELLLKDLDQFDSDSASADLRAAMRFHLLSAASLVTSRDISELNHMTGPVARLSWASRSWPQREDPRFDSYVERLRAFPAYVSDLVREIRAASETVRGSAPVLHAFVSQVDTLFATRASGPDPLLHGMTAAREQGNSVAGMSPEVVERVYQALAELRSVAVAELVTAVPAAPWAFAPSGQDRYREAIFRGTSVPLSPERLEAIGLELLRATETEFTALAGRDFARELIPGDEIMRRFADAHELLTSASRVLVERWPMAQCQVEPMPETNASTGPPAFYGPSSYRNGRPGSLFVNAMLPTSTRLSEVLPLAMHEGVPGHHLQIALLDENDAVPEVLRLLPVNAFTEGWAVYAETLHTEMGLELSELDRLGLLMHQRWRAARLVTDVGLHVRGWSVEQAVEFMARHTLQDVGQVRKEVVRYLAWPGQALGYAVGARAIANHIREMAGSGATLAAAHTALLDRGSLPLTALTGYDRN